MTNEMINVDTETGEIVERANVVEETDNYIITQDQNGKFVRKAKFNEYSSFKAETREDQIWLLSVFEDDEDSGMGLRDNVGKIIEVEHIITRKYDSIDEETGEKIFGVLTYLITPDRKVYVTSSKTVYFNIERITELFGKPHEENWENIKLEIKTKKGTLGDIVYVTMVG